MTAPDQSPSTDEPPPDDGDRATVLLVDDEPDVLALYANWLKKSYDVRTAGGGTEVLPIDDDVDVVLLDRRMPRKSGDEVLEDLRDAGFEGQVGMVTAIDPELDITEMAFDDYVCKPVTEQELYALVERLLKRERLDARLQDWYTVNVKIKRLLEANTEAELEADEDYLELVRFRDDATDEVVDLMTDLNIDDASDLTMTVPFGRSVTSE